MGLELVSGQARVAFEHLFWAGRISSAGRTSQFARRYASLERVLPKIVAAQSISPDLRPSDEEAFHQLMLIAAKAHGVGTERDLRDYFRLKPAMARPARETLVEAGDRIAVSIDGWKRLILLHRDAHIPRNVNAEERSWEPGAPSEAKPALERQLADMASWLGSPPVERALPLVDEQTETD